MGVHLLLKTSRYKASSRVAGHEKCCTRLEMGISNYFISIPNLIEIYSLLLITLPPVFLFIQTFYTIDYSGSSMPDYLIYFYFI